MDFPRDQRVPAPPPTPGSFSWPLLIFFRTKWVFLYLERGDIWYGYKNPSYWQDDDVSPFFFTGLFSQSAFRGSFHALTCSPRPFGVTFSRSGPSHVGWLTPVTFRYGNASAHPKLNGIFRTRPQIFSGRSIFQKTSRPIPLYYHFHRSINSYKVKPIIGVKNIR